MAVHHEETCGKKELGQKGDLQFTGQGGGGKSKSNFVETMG